MSENEKQTESLFDRYVRVRPNGAYGVNVEGPAAWVKTLDMEKVARSAVLLAQASPNPLPPFEAVKLALRMDFAAYIGLMTLGRGMVPGAGVSA